ncbi:hypothetical protein [Anditalea andensis]|uniref:Transporter n=1 Tax=Anditalea andensis TaxID=1048983 RepID=A0A074KXH3_9BACT|nr:hypothetical protein [Anditalea andensis]KEO72925.1 transporter [Anditalea andensis]
MNKYFKSSIGLIVFYLCIKSAYAQMPWDEVKMGKGEVCIAMIYEHGVWNQYWEGNFLRKNDNIGTLTRQAGMVMVAAGLTERINLIAIVPYVATEASGGTQKGQSGLQDLNLSLKAELLKRRVGTGNITLLSNVSYATPMSQYLSDYAPFSIGFGAPELGLRGIAAYKLDNGLIFRSALAYLIRGQAEVERDYYYNNGSIYSQYMDVPNALNFHAAIGYWAMNNQLRLELTYMSLNCLSGDDIRPYNSGQPTNKTEVEQIGSWVQYYINGRKGLGVLAYYNQVIGGRNIGKNATLGIGITYQFQAFNH